MNLWAIVPAKDLTRAKGRLAPSLSLEERRILSMNLLAGTLAAIAGVQGIRRCIVVSPSPRALALAHDHGALPLDEGMMPRVDLSAADSPLPRPDMEAWETPSGRDVALNAGLNWAASAARDWGAEAVLVVPADLPNLSAEALHALVLAGETPRSIAIAPDRHRSGTNALLLHPPLAVPFLFGVDSFAAHCEAARARDLRLSVVDHPALALDLDTPDDLALLGGDTLLPAPIEAAVRADERSA